MNAVPVDIGVGCKTQASIILPVGWRSDNGMNASQNKACHEKSWESWWEKEQEYSRFPTGDIKFIQLLLSQLYRN